MMTQLLVKEVLFYVTCSRIVILTYLEDHGFTTSPLGLFLPLGDSAAHLRLVQVSVRVGHEHGAYQDIVRVLGPDCEGVGVGAVMHGANLVNLK